MGDQGGGRELAPPRPRLNTAPPARPPPRPPARGASCADVVNSEETDRTSVQASGGGGVGGAMPPPRTAVAPPPLPDQPPEHAPIVFTTDKYVIPPSGLPPSLAQSAGVVGGNIGVATTAMDSDGYLVPTESRTEHPLPDLPPLPSSPLWPHPHVASSSDAPAGLRPSLRTLPVVGGDSPAADNRQAVTTSTHAAPAPRRSGPPPKPRPRSCSLADLTSAVTTVESDKDGGGARATKAFWLSKEAESGGGGDQRPRAATLARPSPPPPVPPKTSRHWPVLNEDTDLYAEARTVPAGPPFRPRRASDDDAGVYAVAREVVGWRSAEDLARSAEPTGSAPPPPPRTYKAPEKPPPAPPIGARRSSTSAVGVAIRDGGLVFLEETKVAGMGAVATGSSAHDDSASTRATNSTSGELLHHITHTHAYTRTHACMHARKCTHVSTIGSCDSQCSVPQLAACLLKCVVRGSTRTTGPPPKPPRPPRVASMGGINVPARPPPILRQLPLSPEHDGPHEASNDRAEEPTSPVPLPRSAPPTARHRLDTSGGTSRAAEMARLVGATFHVKMAGMFKTKRKRFVSIDRVNKEVVLYDGSSEDGECCTAALAAAITLHSHRPYCSERTNSRACCCCCCCEDTHCCAHVAAATTTAAKAHPGQVPFALIESRLFRANLLIRLRVFRAIVCLSFC
jgi:hypothetical protein